ncbi:hypothetical protein LshimejAT787_0306070 [Lyophyllum shimeji]|uniref:Uncharacterized protein n=1 Tax=Lyophyllum shimeji TaxID=47721 RepID=A0A9P3PJ01_LYOSH|nr:hypothetical protein LshimejAT787_0306070 [Lyophyllum shimeji]
MPQHSPILAALNSPPDPGFVPRKEFIREQKPALNSFAIVAIAASSCVRLYSFPPSVVTTLRTLLESQKLLAAFREDVIQNLCEFVLDGKPWASPKSVKAEKLLLDILAVVYHCGYTYLSSLDYGRESDDRLAMAFSRPSASPAGSRGGTPLPASASPFRESSSSFSSDKSKTRRVPFALSFLSPTVMRVIAPPLHLTPAILQAVRASWPRGVVSEKKVGDNSFEFKLKGYKWFQQDTFATDSLRLILSLLSSLDAQSFTLLASIALTHRSRVKDLWVFTGPGSSATDDLMRQDSSVPSAMSNSHADIKRRPQSLELSSIQQSAALTQHRKLATEPNGTGALPHPSQHAKAASEDGTGMQFLHGYRQEQQRPVGTSPPPVSPNPAQLRKPAPRAQVPVSVIYDADPTSIDGIRADLPSTISSGVEDMTGVGAARFSPDVFYATPPPGNTIAMPIHVAQTTVHPSPPQHTRPRSPLRPVSTRAKTPPLLTSNRAQSSPPPQSPIPADPQESGSSVPPLLGPGAFRDSAFSSNSDTTYEIPIKWTGIKDTPMQNRSSNAAESASSRPAPNRASSSGPVLPGGWQTTPIEEGPEDDSGVMMVPPDSPTSEEKHGGTKTPIYEVSSRVTSPELTRPDIHLRKSEAALIGLIAERSPPPPLPAAAKNSGADSPSSGSGQGWVLVNVEGTSAALHGESDKNVTSGRATPQSPHPHAAGPERIVPTPQAKAIAIIDAVDAKSKSKAKVEDTSDPTSPTKKRFFGLGRKGSKKSSTSQGNADSLLPPAETHNASANKPRSGFRDRLRLIGTPEASRNEDKRRSID